MWRIYSHSHNDEGGPETVLNYEGVVVSTFKGYFCRNLDVNLELITKNSLKYRVIFQFHTHVSNFVIFTTHV